MNSYIHFFRALCLVVGCSLATGNDEASDFVSAYEGPCDVAASPDGKRLYVVENAAPPMMISGEPADAVTAVRAAFRHIQFEVVPEDKAKAVDAYMKSLRPTLIECWRTGPYLHDARYTTVKEVLATGNHGSAADRLSDSQIDDLAEFVLSLSDVPVDGGLPVDATKETLPPNSTDNPLGLDKGLISLQIAEPPKELAVEKKTLPTLKVRVFDKDGEPITGASVLLYDRNHYMAAMPVDFKQVSKRTGEDGWADLGALPQEFVCVQVNGRPHSLGNGQTRVLGTAYVVIGGDGEGGFQQANPDKPMAKMELDDEANTLSITFTMRQGVDLQFEALDAETGTEVFFTGVFYRDEQRSRWWHPVLLDGSGGQHDFWPMTEDVSERSFRMASPGYRPVDFQLEEKLELGKQYQREIELVPAPDIRFTVLTPEGEPAEGASFKWIHPKGLSNITTGKRTTDANGVLAKRYPAQGDLTSFEITHESGRATVAVKDLPEPTTVTEGGESRDVIPCEVRLSSDDAIQAKLLPGEFKYGKQSLTVHTINDSSMTHFLAPGDYPHEILVDGVTYRAARYNIGWYAIKPRPIPPRSRDHGSVLSLPECSGNSEEVKPIQLSGSVFSRPDIWVNYETRVPLQLTPDKHTVHAVFYLLDPKTGRRGRRVLSNPIEIGADGRAVDIDSKRPEADFRDVTIRLLGGEARKPLAGLELTVFSGGTESYTATTLQDGGASFRLPYGYHRVSFTSPKDLPYLPFRTDSLYWSGDSRSIRVAETPGKQTIDMILADPCELVLRAVDANTGEGIPGVRFALESEYEEAWADPIVNETIRPPSKDRRVPQVDPNDKSLVTDEQGYFRRYVGPRHDEWAYWVDVCPDGYRQVASGGRVKIDTSLGKKRAEYTFLFRRRD